MDLDVHDHDFVAVAIVAVAIVAVAVAVVVVVPGRKKRHCVMLGGWRGSDVTMMGNLLLMGGREVVWWRGEGDGRRWRWRWWLGRGEGGKMLWVLCRRPRQLVSG